MKQFVELLTTQEVDDLKIGDVCKDDFVESLEVNLDIAEDYYNKAEELFSEDKALAFKYYKLAYKNNYWLAPYMLGIYFEYGIDKFVKSDFLAFEFYKEAINRDDLRAYAQIADLVDDVKDKLVLWKKLFTHHIMKDLDYKLNDFANYNIDYRAIFLYKFKKETKYEKEIKEIIDIIKPSLLRDYDEIKERLDTLLAGDISDIEEEIFNEIIFILNLIKNNQEDEYFLEDEDMGLKLERLIKRKKTF